MITQSSDRRTLALVLRIAEISPPLPATATATITIHKMYFVLPRVEEYYDYYSVLDARLGMTVAQARGVSAGWSMLTAECCGLWMMRENIVICGIIN